MPSRSVRLVASHRRGKRPVESAARTEIPGTLRQWRRFRGGGLSMPGYRSSRWLAVAALLALVAGLLPVPAAPPSGAAESAEPALPVPAPEPAGPPPATDTDPTPGTGQAVAPNP